MTKRTRIASSVAAVALLASPVLTMASGPIFTPPTGYDAATLFGEVVTGNKALIIGGASAVIFLGIVKSVIKGLGRRGASISR